ncbi:MAG: hypothetical protein JNN08_31165, partial [Bryobacterales bacterium]|nr:hypothetical protein [Bryobacterales bacterium]
MLAELAMFGRYARGLRGYFRKTISLEQAKDLIRDQLRRREPSLLHLLRHAVYGNPRSPYRALLEWAGIELGDIEGMITRDGVESALGRLCRAGVYVTIEEFKGKRPIRRAGLELPTRHEDFDNPLLTVHFEGRTGGSGGARRRLLLDLGLIGRDAASHRIFMESFGLVNRPQAVWRPVPPNNSGIKKPLMDVRIGVGLSRWFSQTPTLWNPTEFRYAAFTAYTVWAARRAGHRFPSPEHVPLEKADVVARWMAEMAGAGRPAFLDSAVSAAVRVCTAARELNLDIAGSMFRTGGESLSPTRAQIIRDSGARVACHFSMSEVGPVGMACSNPAADDNVHILTEKMAVIQKEDCDGVLLLTTLFASCPKVLLNVETGDSGTLERRGCGCLFSELGNDLHLHHIRSHEKLTAEGIHFLPSDLLRLIDDVLPATFGGAPTDYQLMEQDHNGLPRVSIVVSPRLGPIDESRAIAVALATLAHGNAGNRLMAGQLDQARSLTVLRREPFTTPAAKVLPLYVV